MKVEFLRSFEKDLGKIRDPALLQKIRATIEDIEAAEGLNSLTHLKKLKTEGNYYRIRIGNHRIGISLQGSVVVFVRVLPRKDIYKYFP
jgi:mRNA interferase RelE/StbE